MKSRMLMCFGVIAFFVALHISLAAQEKQPVQRYKFFDMGTFGGPTSIVFEGELLLNNDSTLVGGADTSTVDPYKPDCFHISCYVQNAFKPHNGKLTDLGALPGGRSRSLVPLTQTEESCRDV
jgi:hypothetical protein